LVKTLAKRTFATDYTPIAINAYFSLIIKQVLNLEGSPFSTQAD